MGVRSEPVLEISRPAVLTGIALDRQGPLKLGSERMQRHGSTRVRNRRALKKSATVSARLGRGRLGRWGW